MEEDSSAFKMLTDKRTEKIPLGRPRRRWKDNIILHLKKVSINMRNWVDSAQDMDYWKALVSAA